MRKLFLGALVGVLTLAMAAIAVAATVTSDTTVQNYDQTFSSKKVKTATGTTFSTSSTDEQNPRNKQPKRVADFDITFPKGSKVNSKAVPQCKADEEDFAEADNPDQACPKGSKIGSGVVAARLPFSGTADLTGTVRAYNAKKGLLLLVNVESPGAAQTLLLKPKWRGLKLLTDVPHTCLPPNQPSNNCRDQNGQEQSVILTNFELKVKTATSGKGKKKKALITTPSSCPKGTWPFRADIGYGDGSKVRIDTTSPCAKK